VHPCKVDATSVVGQVLIRIHYRRREACNRKLPIQGTTELLAAGNDTGAFGMPIFILGLPSLGCGDCSSNCLFHAIGIRDDGHRAMGQRFVAPGFVMAFIQIINLAPFQ